MIQITYPFLCSMYGQLLVERNFELNWYILPRHFLPNVHHLRWWVSFLDSPVILPDLFIADLFQSNYGFSPGAGGLAYLGLGFGYLLASFSSAKFADWIYKYVSLDLPHFASHSWFISTFEARWEERRCFNTRNAYSPHRLRVSFCSIGHFVSSFNSSVLDVVSHLHCLPAGMVGALKLSCTGLCLSSGPVFWLSDRRQPCKFGMIFVDWWLCIFIDLDAAFRSYYIWWIHSPLPQALLPLQQQVSTQSSWVPITHSDFLSSSSAHCLALLSHYLAKICSINLDLEVVARYAIACQIFVCLFKWLITVLFQLLGGLAIFLGIPFPVYLYYRGEALRAANPLTRASTLAKFKSWACITIPYLNLQRFGSHRPVNHNTYTFTHFSVYYRIKNFLAYLYRLARRNPWDWYQWSCQNSLLQFGVLASKGLPGIPGK